MKLIPFWTFLLLFMTGCFLDYKIESLNGATKSSDSYIPELAPVVKSIDLTKSKINTTYEKGYRYIQTQVSIETKDQFGNPIYESNKIIEFTSSGTIQDGWFSNIVDHNNGTYTADYYFENTNPNISFGAKIDSQDIVTSNNKNLIVVEPRLKFTGNSAPSTNVLSRIFNEITSPAFTVTGECDVELGVVNVTGKNNLADSSFSIAVPCDQTNGGTFTLNINYASTIPFFSKSTGIVFVLISQSSSPEKITSLYKLPSTISINPIATTNSLQSIICNDTNYFYYLTNDIDVESETGIATENYTMPCSGLGFSGILDGNGYTIKNIHKTSGLDAGIISRTNEGSINNLNIKNITFVGLRVGGVVGRGSNSTVYFNLNADNLNLTGSSSGTGGLIGNDSSSFELSYSTVKNSVINGNTNTGGIVGYGWTAIIKRCSVVNTNVTGSFDRTGGIAGYGYNVLESFSEGVITGRKDTGGIAGSSFGGGFYNNYSTASIVSLSGDNVGGIVGSTTGSFGQNNYFLGSVSSTSSITGPLVGLMSGIVTLTNFYYSADLNCPACTVFTQQQVMSTNNLNKRESFSSFNFKTLWKIDQNNSPPTLREFP